MVVAAVSTAGVVAVAGVDENHLKRCSEGLMAVSNSMS
jgi:hypothetical protein